MGKCEFRYRSIRHGLLNLDWSEWEPIDQIIWQPGILVINGKLFDGTWEVEAWVEVKYVKDSGYGRMGER